MERVIVVDDEEWVRYFLANGIDWAALGATVVGEAATGLEALLLCDRNRPDLIITDIRMPEMDGVELFRLLRDQYPRAKTIVVSGHDEFEYARSAVSAGVFDYLLKPVSRSDLETVVNRALGAIRAERSAERRREQARKEILKLRDAVVERDSDAHNQPVPGARTKETREAGDADRELSATAEHVKRVAQIVRERYSEPLTLTSVADMVFLNPRYLSTIFKRHVGKGFKEYVQEVRMENAKALLRNGELSVREVAELVGFDDSHYFSRIFSRWTGIHPSVYRNNS